MIDFPQPPTFDKSTQTWMLLTNNGKAVITKGADGPEVDFYFASKHDMLLDISNGLKSRRCLNRMDWTVAQHSILVARLMALVFPEEPWGELDGLFHDAHEAYIGDIPNPVGGWLLDLNQLKQAFDDGIARFLDFDFPRTPKHKISMVDKLAWDLESAHLLDFDPNDPFIIANAYDMVVRKKRGLDWMTKGHAPEIPVLFEELKAGRHTFLTEYQRITRS